MQGWHALSLAFIEQTVTAYVDGVAVATKVPITSAWNGVAGVGSGRHHAYFDDLRLAPVTVPLATPPPHRHPPTQHAGSSGGEARVATAGGLTAGSFVLDVTPMGDLCLGCHHPIPYDKPAASGPTAAILHRDGGWAGMILDNSQNHRSVQLLRFGRYRVPGTRIIC